MPEVCWNRIASSVPTDRTALGEQRVDRAGEIRPVALAGVGGLGQLLAPRAAGRSGRRGSRQQFGDRVARRSSTLGHQPGQPEHLRAQDPVGDAALGLVDHVGQSTGWPPAQLGVQRVSAGSPAGSTNTRSSRQRVVAGGARARPVRRQLLVALEDLLDQHVPARRSARPARRGSRPGRRARPDGRPAGRRPSPARSSAGSRRAIASNTPGTSTRIAGQRVDGEEPPVVQVGSRPAAS